MSGTEDVVAKNAKATDEPEAKPETKVEDKVEVKPEEKVAEQKTEPETKAEEKAEEKKEEKKEEVAEDKKEEKTSEEKKEEKASEEKKEEKKEKKSEGAEEEEELTTGPWKLPNVQVQLSTTGTGEEDEDCLWSHRSKLYRWRNSDWKERGLGDSKLLQDKKTKKIRFLLRQEKTGKIVANHYVLPRDKMCTLTPNAGSETILVWSAIDCSEEESRPEQFALKFGQAEAAQKFNEEFTKAGKENLKLYESGAFN